MKFFRNLRLYRLEGWRKLDDEALQEHLEAQRLNPCGKLEEATAGWASPYGRGDERLAHTANNCHLLRYGVQERVLPPAVIKEAIAERAEAYQERTGSRPNRRTLVTLKDEVMMSLLPQAFVKPGHVDAYLDPDAGWLVVDAASAKRGEDVAALLRQTFEGLKLKTIDADTRIRTHLTHWLSEARCPGELDFGDECDLRDDADAGATVRCRHQDLEAAEIRQHLQAGKRAVKLGLSWAGRLSFSLAEDFGVSRLKPEDMLVDSIEDLPDAEDEIMRLDAAFVLMALEVRALLEKLVEVLELDREAD